MSFNMERLDWTLHEMQLFKQLLAGESNVKQYILAKTEHQQLPATVQQPIVQISFFGE